MYSCRKIDGNKFSMFLNFFNVISKIFGSFFNVFFFMFCLSIFFLFYIFAFLCFVDLCFVIDPSHLYAKHNTSSRIDHIIGNTSWLEDQYPVE